MKTVKICSRFQPLKLQKSANNSDQHWIPTFSDIKPINSTDNMAAKQQKPQQTLRQWTGNGGRCIKLVIKYIS